MADIDDQIDTLYQGPLDAFTEARNALAKAAKRADLKTLQKPSLPAWVVNQLHWHRRPALDRLEAAAEAVRAEHGKALVGKPADVRSAEQAHRDLVKDTLAAAREVLAEGGHPATPATLDAVRETLQALPSPEATGRLTRALSPQGFEALAGLAVAAPARPAMRVVPAPTNAPTPAPPANTDTTARDRDAERAAARAQAERDRLRREAQLEAAKHALDAARATLKQAEAALAEAERETMKRRTERNAAADAVEKALKALRE